ncbi:hypothetical protein BDY21DRAFT_361122 [Lineolata rhizophorae]|uniref:Uncharacterized protein n=1 Tax=Lineolata rhizophorae TaxID=578093 RepID=A0A6A6PB48_9PEZI|nr:hypothetical protein BDY21DRAFT_361122 [Lineolata rhizophorae]
MREPKALYCILPAAEPLRSFRDRPGKGAPDARPGQSSDARAPRAARLRKSPGQSCPCERASEREARRPGAHGTVRREGKKDRAAAAEGPAVCPLKFRSVSRHSSLPGPRRACGLGGLGRWVMYYVRLRRYGEALQSCYDVKKDSRAIKSRTRLLRVGAPRGAERKRGTVPG